MRNDRSEKEVKRFTNKLRVYAWGHQDAGGLWIQENFPDVFYLVSTGGILYSADPKLRDKTWLDTHVCSNQGPLGALCPLRKDELGGADSETCLGLIPNGLSALEHPGYVSDERMDKGLAHSDRLIPFCVLDPRKPSGGRKIIDVLREYAGAGARGFGEYKMLDLALDAPESMPVYEACAELGLPVLLHIEDQYCIDEIGLPRFAKVLAAFPECVFIAHGPGWWASISGDVRELRGYPKTPVTAGGACDRLLATYPNLYCDLSAGSGANAIGRDLDFGREFLIRHSDRTMFFTDSGFPKDFARTKDKVHFEQFGAMELPRRVKSKILRENARGLLEIV